VGGEWGRIRLPTTSFATNNIRTREPGVSWDLVGDNHRIARRFKGDADTGRMDRLVWEKVYYRIPGHSPHPSGFWRNWGTDAQKVAFA